MNSDYLPPCAFLRTIIREETSLEDQSNLRRLIAMTREEEVRNRDWAALLLAQQSADTLEVREALLAFADDDDAVVRAEAILGLAKRDRLLALAPLQKELSREKVAQPIFEAAAIVADPSLIEDLQDFAKPTGDVSLDEEAFTALRACELGRRD
jgi:hypothetical protein